jgi:AraC-like DNA-binding protein
MPPRLAITRASGMGGLPGLLERRGGAAAVARTFAAEGLPLALIHERGHWLPLDALAGLFERGARATGDPLFGLSVGLGMAPADYGRWAAYALQADTLGGCIGRLGRFFHLHQRGGSLVLEPRPGGRVAWSYRHADSRSARFAQHGDHVLPGMIETARSYLGPRWRPEAVEVGHSDRAHARDREDALGAAWLFGRGGAGIVLRRDALSVRRRSVPMGAGGRRITTAELLAEPARAAAAVHAERIGSILALRLLDGRTDIDGAARLLGIGRRTLQRQLAEDGTSYRALLDRVRMERAKALIEESDLPMMQVSFDVGYGDPAHFSRAFARYFGHPPSRLRRRA